MHPRARSVSYWSAFLAGFGTVMFTAGSAPAQVSATLILQENDSPPGAGGADIDALLNPFTNGLGQPGFIGELDTGAHFLWVNDGIIWLSSDAVGNALSLSSDSRHTMGFSNTGAWIYQPVADGEDALWTQNGMLLRAGDAAPGYAGAERIHSLIRPTMLPDGTIYWVAGIDSEPNGTRDARALYTSSTGTLGDAAIVLRTGDLVDGVPLATVGVEENYDVSTNGQHYIAVVDRDTGSSGNDKGLVVDGVLVVQEGVTLTGPGATEVYEGFDQVAIDNGGNYLMAGSTDDNPLLDVVIAYNGVVSIRESDNVGGVVLGAPARIRAISMDNSGVVAHLWNIRDLAEEVLFTSTTPHDLAGNSRILLRTGDLVDLDGDGVGDAAVTDFNATDSRGPGLDLADDGHVLVEVDLDYDFDGIGENEAILRLAINYCGDGAVDATHGEECDDGGESAACDLDCTLALCGDGFVNATASESCDTGGIETADCDLDCTDATCGDGQINDAAGEICDDSGESAECDIDCTAAFCGDNVVNTTAGEQCDTGGEGFSCGADCRFTSCGDGVLDDGEACDDGGESAACDADCTPAECGDGMVNGSAGEGCDDEGESAACNADCSVAMCGDSVINGAAGEGCDDGGESDVCNADCSPAVCGDGVLNETAGEQCDDGNTVSGDGCAANCGQDGTVSDGGCGCATGGTDADIAGQAALWLGLALLGLRRRRRLAHEPQRA